MRLHLKMTSNSEPIPFEHLGRLTGVLHRWLGENDLHDKTSLYSFGWLKGGQSVEKRHLTFQRGATWNISFHDAAVAHALCRGILRKPTVFGGMRVYEVQQQPLPAFGGCVRFLTDRSHIIVRKDRPEGGKEYLLYNHPEADAALTRVLRWKLKAAGYEGEHLAATVQFDKTYTKARTRKSTIKGIEHKGSECPIVVTGTPEVVQFVWVTGAGELTGSGFGGLQ